MRCFGSIDVTDCDCPSQPLWVGCDCIDGTQSKIVELVYGLKVNGEPCGLSSIYPTVVKETSVKFYFHFIFLSCHKKLLEQQDEAMH